MPLPMLRAQVRRPLHLALQLMGDWRVKHEGLKPYHAAATDLKRRFASFEAKQVGRRRGAPSPAPGRAVAPRAARTMCGPSHALLFCLVAALGTLLGLPVGPLQPHLTTAPPHPAGAA